MALPLFLGPRAPHPFQPELEDGLIERYCLTNPSVPPSLCEELGTRSFESIGLYRVGLGILREAIFVQKRPQLLVHGADMTQ